MAKRYFKTGPLIHSLIEDAPINLTRELISLRRGDNDPEIALPGDNLNEDEFREVLAETLAEFDLDDLRPLEQRCRRIRVLADGKGVSSLDTIVEQRLDDAQCAEYSNQVDPLCRSIWAFLNHGRVFEDAESFHFARQFRDHGKMYDAFEVELEKAINLDADAIDETVLASKITTVLELKTTCTVKALDLPSTDAHPASIMLIVRHGGPLSSVHDHRDDGRRGTIYFRPPNEATLIYTPSKRQIEI